MRNGSDLSRVRKPFGDMRNRKAGIMQASRWSGAQIRPEQWSWSVSEVTGNWPKRGSGDSQDRRCRQLYLHLSLGC
jgi:hypothetical protein